MVMTFEHRGYTVRIRRIASGMYGYTAVKGKDVIKSAGFNQVWGAKVAAKLCVDRQIDD